VALLVRSGHWLIWFAFPAEVVVMLAVVPNRKGWLSVHPLEVAIVVFTPPFLPAGLQALRVSAFCGWWPPPAPASVHGRRAPLRRSASTPLAGVDLRSSLIDRQRKEELKIPPVTRFVRLVRTFDSLDAPRVTERALVSMAAVSAVTGVVFLLHGFVPVLSLGALYVLAVLPVAVLFGRTWAIVASIGSMLVFNYFFLPPRLTFTLSGNENWLALSIYVVTGLIVADLAARARLRAREAERREQETALLAEASAVLLSGAELADELDRVAEGAARVLGVNRTRIELGLDRSPRQGEAAHALISRGRHVATLYLDSGRESSLEGRRRFVEALASLLAVAIDRDKLAHEALEAEALRRSDSIKTSVLRAVSHDLRSPLTAIRAALEALQSSDLTLDPTDRERLLRTAITETKRLNRVVRNLLDLSTLQAGALRSRPKRRTIESVLDQALVHIGSDQRVDVSSAADLPLVSVDAVQLEHALVNLLENALKFSPTDSRVTVYVDKLADEVIIRIADRGPGLASGELELVFEPFQHGSTTGRGRGAGLGLAIAKGFVEASGGRIWAESSPGEGASFWLALPAATETAPAGQPADTGTTK
jgi:two-component system, OmpR family, sensor histidine kinase KdpD